MSSAMNFCLYRTARLSLRRAERCLRLFSGSIAPEVNRPGKLFFESENTFAHRILEKKPAYSETLVKEGASSRAGELAPGEGDDVLRDTRWEEIALEEIPPRFRRVSLDAALNTGLPISHQRYADMCSRIVPRFKDMSDEHIADILMCLNLWPLSESPREPNFYKFWKELDRICMMRRRSWTLNKMLYFVDLWYMNRLTRMSDYVFNAIRYFGRKPQRLSSSQLVQVLFYLNALRSKYKGIPMFEIELRLEQCCEELTMEELGVAAMGFFKTQTGLRSESFQNYIVTRLINEIDTIPEIALTSFVKLLRMTLLIQLWPRMPSILDALESQLDRLSVKSCAHIALLSTRSQTLHPQILEKVSKRLVEDIKESRLKDIEKVMFPLTMLNYVPGTAPDIFSKVMKEIESDERANEFVKYPKCLVAIVHYLAIRSLFSHKTISKVLDMDFIRSTYGKSNYIIGREILSIDSCIELECPEYTGPRLPKDIRNYLSKRYSSYLPDPKRKLSKHEIFMWELIQTADIILGKDFVACKYILPHSSRADLVFCLDSDGNPLAIPETFRDVEDFTGPVKPLQGQWKVIVPYSKNMYVFNRPDLPNGETLCKLRHLRVLGYHPILIPLIEWPTDGGKRVDHLKKKIFQ